MPVRVCVVSCLAASGCGDPAPPSPAGTDSGGTPTAPTHPTIARFEEIEVERINVVEPDGTLRLVVSNRARYPGPIIRGDEYAFDRAGQVGLLFYNDEGSECGGLGYGGAEGSQFVALTGDKYEQDQLVSLSAESTPGGYGAGLRVSDRPDRSIREDLEEMEGLTPQEMAEIQASKPAGYYGTPRMFVGRDGDGSTSLNLLDAAGLNRLRVSVDADGSAAIEFLDPNGAVVRRITPTDG